ncbi:MAG TPA: phosphotransferase [Ignavibacteria bacterium]|nr:phosphotransferase [Ignavibacteria bacterium]
MSYKNEIILNTFQELIYKITGSVIESVIQLKAHASERNIFRLKSNGKSYVGIFNENEKENIAFVSFSRTFLNLGLNVPEILSVSDDSLFYIEEDLGDTTLYEFAQISNKISVMDYYEKALSDLLKFQITAKDSIEYKYCYQTMKFNERVLREDVKKFSDYYLGKISGNKELLKEAENITEICISLIQNVPDDFFMYRDFQPRNIMIMNNELYYIDYQSGRKGPLQYDVASFLYSGSIDINDSERMFLLSHYENELGNYIEYNKEEFRVNIYNFAFIRLLQVLGSYSYIFEKRKDVKMKDKISNALIKMKGLNGYIENEKVNGFIKNLTR